jgi:hypothetical protein
VVHKSVYTCCRRPWWPIGGLARADLILGFLLMIRGSTHRDFRAVALSKGMQQAIRQIILKFLHAREMIWPPIGRGAEPIGGFFINQSLGCDSRYLSASRRTDRLWVACTPPSLAALGAILFASAGGKANAAAFK